MPTDDERAAHRFDHEPVVGEQDVESPTLLIIFGDAQEPGTRSVSLGRVAFTVDATRCSSR